MATVQREAKAAKKMARQLPFSRDSRFGDEEPVSGPRRVGRVRPHDKKSAAVGPISGGSAQAFTENGFAYLPRGAMGASATAVDRWEHSNPGKAAVSRRPDAHDWINGLGPGRYQGYATSPSQERVGPRWHIGQGGSRLAKVHAPASLDAPMISMPSAFGVQRLSNAGRSEPSITFGGVVEDRMELRRPLSQSALDASARALHKQRASLYGHELDASDLKALEESARVEAENGAHTQAVYLPRSDFDGGGRQSMRASKSFSFGGSNTSSRFFEVDARLGDSASGLGARSASRASLGASPKPLHSKSGGGAFRDDPPASPGPGAYTISRGFDGSGKMLLGSFRSQPSYSLTGRKELAKICGRPDEVPAPGAYF